MTHRGPFQPLLFCDSVILWGLHCVPQGTCAAWGYADWVVHRPRPLLSSSPPGPKIYFLGNSGIEIYGEALHV